MTCGSDALTTAACEEYKVLERTGRGRAMDRRHFLKKSLEKGALVATGLAASGELLAARPEKTPSKPITRRPLGKTGERLSILGFGGIVVMSVEQSSANNIVAEAVDRGIN